jgi:hypothetical protein
MCSAMTVIHARATDPVRQPFSPDMRAPGIDVRNNLDAKTG